MLTLIRYVVEAVSLPALAPPASASTSFATPAAFPRPEPSVLIGIFPASVVHVRASETNDDGSLTEAYEKAMRMAQEKIRNGSNNPWFGEMEAVKEEDEDIASPKRLNGPVIEIPGFGNRQSLPQPSSIARPNRPKSLILDMKGAVGMAVDKEQPPLPKLTAGDSTIAGQEWPLVDEIPCAIREWYGVSTESWNIQ